MVRAVRARLRPMVTDRLRSAIDELWELRDTLSAATTGAARDAVEEVLTALDAGALRVAEPAPAEGSARWVVNQWVKKAVLLSFRLQDSAPLPGAGGAPVYDKVPLKFAGW